MSLPRFLDRVLDATAPLLAGVRRADVRTRLNATSVTLRAGDTSAQGPLREGLLLAANLAARLYPTIRLVGPPELMNEARADITLVNPKADVAVDDEPTQGCLNFDIQRQPDERGVVVSARGWNVYVDATRADGPQATVPAALLAATLGMAELFRLIFAEELGAHGRRHPQPGSFNVVTLGEPTFDTPPLEEVDLGRFSLVGAGAIGQAAALALAKSGVVGTMFAVDSEKLAVSNLQRYLLTRDDDVGAVKVDLLRERLSDTGLEVVPIPMRWDHMLVDGQTLTLVALDTPEDRIGVQASLPGPVYNAWTQPSDVGWSRHERFGDQPCLACLYWPDHERPGRHEQIAASFGQHPLRVLGYLVHRTIPVGLPLPSGAVPTIPGLDPPPESSAWTERALLDDIAATAGVDAAELDGWRERPLADVYQEGICGGALLHLELGDTPKDVLVPLAHQSAYAGIMLATEVIAASVPELRKFRPPDIEGRYDVLAGLPQVLARPRLPADRCLCTDRVFLDVYRRRTTGSGDQGT